MEKVYIKAEYRIPGEVYSSGYICISKEETKGLFALDKVTIKIQKHMLYVYLEEFDTSCYEYLPVQTYKCRIDSDTLECPNTYVLRFRNVSMQLRLLEKVSNPKFVSKIFSDYNTYF